MPDAFDRLAVHQLLRMDLPADEFLRACANEGVRRVGLLRDGVATIGVEATADLLGELGLSACAYSSIGYWANGMTFAGEPWTLKDSVSAMDDAVRLGAPLMVPTSGPMAPGDRDIEGARRRFAEGLLELVPHATERGLRLAIEAVHPLLCPTRSVVASLGFSIELARLGPPDVLGIVLDTYHVWWDPHLYELIADAADRTFTVHINDFVLPAPEDGRRRGLMGEGCIDLARFRAAVEAAGYKGLYEVEVVNEVLTALPPREAVRRVVESYRGFMA